jgi:hypothetical protein
MSQPQYPPPQYPPSGKAPTWMPPAPPAKRGRGLRIVLLIVLGLLGLVVVIGLIGAMFGDKPPATAGVTATANTVVKPTETGGGEFTVRAKVVDRKCGAAGCQVTWVPELVYDGPLPAKGETWTVSYKVVGVESGTSAGKILISSTGPAKQNEKRNRTAAEGDEITLQVTSVNR